MASVNISRLPGGRIAAPPKDSAISAIESQYLKEIILRKKK